MTRARSMLAAVFLCGCVAHPALASPGPPGRDRVFHVFMLLWRGESDVERGFRAYVEEKGLPFRLTVRSADQDERLARRYVAEAKALRPDLVYTWGTTATLAAAGEFDKVDPAANITDIPIVFTMVADPVGARIVPDVRSSGRNVSGVTQTVPVDSEIEAISAYRPVTKLAIIYNPTEVNSVLKVAELRAAGAARKFTVLDRAIPLDHSGRPNAELIPTILKEIVAERPQFLYLGPDTYVAKRADQITRFANDERLPSFAGVELVLCQSHALFGLFARYHTLGKLTARKVEQILVEKQRPQDIPIESVNTFTYVINQTVMSQLQLYPPMSVLDYARVVKSCDELGE